MSLNSFSTPSSKGPPELTLSGSHSNITSTASYETLDSLFLDAGLSPPSKSTSMKKDSIIKEAKTCLAHGNFDWEGLSSREKVFVAFLVWKKQHEFLSSEMGLSPAKIASAIHEAATDMISRKNQTLDIFLRKGGDKSLMAVEEENERKELNDFEGRHPEWSSHDSPLNMYTIFTTECDKADLSPVIRYQTHDSKVCFVVSATNAILYYMWLTHGGKRDSIIESYGINVGRYMRNHFLEKQIFDMVFRDDGGYPEQVLEHLLTNAVLEAGSPANRPKTMPVYLDLFRSSKFNAVSILSHNVEMHLALRGPLMVTGFKIFKEYLDLEKEEFHGNLYDKYTLLEKHTLHAFLIVGVRETGSGEMGGIQFLVQDSLIDRPFVGIGLDLLHSMQIHSALGIKNDVSFRGVTNDSMLDGVPICVTSGSPRPPQNISSDADIAVSESLTMEGEDNENGSSSRAHDSAYIGLTIPEELKGKNFSIWT